MTTRIWRDGLRRAAEAAQRLRTRAGERSPRSSLSVLIEEARARVALMSPEELEAMLREQRRSWVRGEMGLRESAVMRRPDPPLPSDRCVCEGMAAAGDAAPRLWVCPLHGQTGMVMFGVLADRWVPAVFETREEAWEVAHGLLLRRQVEHRLRGEVYHCEDHFWGDLQRMVVAMQRDAGRSDEEIVR